MEMYFIMKKQTIIFSYIWSTVTEDILLPEKYDYDEQQLINNIVNNRKKGKTHHLIINAEGIGHSTSMAKRIEAATGVETRATILGSRPVQKPPHPPPKVRDLSSTLPRCRLSVSAHRKADSGNGLQFFHPDRLFLTFRVPSASVLFQEAFFEFEAALP